MPGYHFKENDYLHIMQSYNRIFEPNHVMPRIHRHIGIEIMYVLSGKAIVRMYDADGAQTEQYKLSSGDFFFLESDRLHQLFTADCVTRIVNLELAPVKEQQFAYQRTVGQIMKGDRRLADLFAESQTFRLFDNGELLYILLMILRRFPDRAEKYAELEALLIVLFDEVADLYRQNERQYRGYAYVKRAVNEIENDVSGCTPDLLAEAVGVSRVYLQKLFRLCFNMGIAEYINYFRCMRAQAYLRRNPSAQIGEVAKEFGFHSMLHFERVFGKLCGCSPREYREKVRKVPEEWTFEKAMLTNEYVFGGSEGNSSLVKNKGIIKIL